LTQWSKGFALIAGTLLLASALGSCLIATGDSQLLTLPDPLLGIRLRLVVLALGLGEMLVALICLFGKPRVIQLVLVAWLTMNWAVYRLGLVWTNSDVRGSALGRLTDPLRLAELGVGRWGQWLPALLLTGALVLLLAHWRQPKTKETLSLKVACPGCGGHIAFPATKGVWKVACPHCGGGIRLNNLPRIA
jgi:rRNA maturation protein Nop10